MKPYNKSRFLQVEDEHTEIVLRTCLESTSRYLLLTIR
jgi:hypothetical protein